MNFLSRTRAVRVLLRRYLIASWLSNILPVLSVGVGVFFFTVVLSIMGGFVHNLKERLLALEPHLEVIVKDRFGMIPANEDLLKKIKLMSREIVAASPFQKGDAILQAGTRPMTIVLIGVDPKYAKTGTMYEKYFGGKDIDILSRQMVVPGVIPEMTLQPLVVGKEIFNFLNVDLSERVTLVSTTQDQGPLGLAPTQFPAIIADQIALGNASVDSKWVIGNLDFINSFFGVEDEWAGVHILLKDAMNADEVALQLNPKLAPLGLRAKPWTESNHALLKALQLERYGMSFVLAMVVLVGCFGITIVLVLAVRRKSREIAILRAMGMGRVSLGIVYLLQGTVIGGLGVLSGSQLGLLVLHILKTVKFTSMPFGEKPPPVLVDPSQIAVISLGSLLLCMLASVWPAMKVMSIDPVEVLADRG